MHRARWLIGGGVIVVAALGVGAWYVFGSSTPAKPKLADSKTVSTGGPATPVGSWKLTQNKNVYVGYRMTEVFSGDIIHKTAVGRTPAVTGTLTISGSQATATDVVADMRQLTSDRTPRDNYIHTNAIQSDTFPHSEFKLTQPIAFTSSLRKGVTQHLTAIGSLTLHGVTRTIHVALVARWNGPTIDVEASDIPIVLADYRIKPPNTSVVKVDNHGSLEFSLEFVPA